MRAGRAAVRIAAAAAMAFSLAACGGGGDGSTLDTPEEGEAASGSGARPEAPAEGPDAAVDSASGQRSAPEAAAIVPAERAMVYQADLTVRVDDVEDAIRRTEQITTAAGGGISSSERSGGDSGSTGTARLVLRVPPDRFWPVIHDLESLGTRVQLMQSSQDVTAEVADVESRITSQRRVIETFRKRLDQATSIADILALESEIARREAELEALEARQRVLNDQVDLATVSVTLAAEEASLPNGDDDLGFLSGLEAGWRGLRAAVTVVLTIIGAVLPFTVVALVMSVPLWLLLRRRFRQRSAPISGTTEPEPASPTPGG